LGKDFSGNGNYWTTNNISITSGVTYDSMTDVPTLTSATAANFAVLNPLDFNSGTVSNANLQWASTATVGNGCFSTFAFDIASTANKYYWEFTLSSGDGLFGIVPLTTLPSNTSRTGSYSYYTNGNKYTGTSFSAYGASFTSGDIIGVAVGSGTITFYKNGTSQGAAFTSLTGNFKPAIWEVSGTFVANFGQRPFAYTPPTGFVALNTFNLPTSTIVNGAKEIGILLYTGDGTTSKDVTGLSFQPDLTYVKNRSAASDPTFSDTLRGITKVLYTDATSAESTAPSFGYINSILSTGFNVNSGGGTEANFNKSGQNYVGWTWKAGQGTNTTNTNGTITSTVSVNTSAGLSMVTYTGTGANATVGHGLGVAPSWIICKSRGTGGTNWGVWHTSLTAYSYFLQLNTTAAQATAANSLQALPTSTLVSLGASSIFNDASTMVMYAWTPIAGYSAFGSYTGNGSADGPFIYTNFQPKFVLIKASSTTSQWVLWDAARNTYNVTNSILYPNLSAAEASFSIDILSNGFKFREAGGAGNDSGVTYIYAAFATSPFKNSLAR
jgi:hypothetical protein